MGCYLVVLFILGDRNHCDNLAFDDEEADHGRGTPEGGEAE